MEQNSNEKFSQTFIYEEVKRPNDRPKELGTFILANTTPLANEHLPFPKDYQFESCLIQSQFQEFADQIRNFKVQSDDVWLISYPKTGSTWVENIIWQLKNGTDARKKPIALFDELFLENFVEKNLRNHLDKLAMASSPRIIKSHLPPQLLPIELWTVRPKIIYIARNPKDVAISLYHMLCGFFNKFTGTIEEFFDVFLADEVEYAPFHAHVINFWTLRHSVDNLLFLTYEEMSANRFDGIKRISKFLECKYSDDELKQITKYAAFGNMQKLYHAEELSSNEVNGNTEFRFFRKGKSGSFPDEMSEEYIAKFDTWTATCLKDSDFKFAL